MESTKRALLDARDRDRLARVAVDQRRRQNLDVSDSQIVWYAALRHAVFQGLAANHRAARTRTKRSGAVRGASRLVPTFDVHVLVRHALVRTRGMLGVD